MWHWRGQTGYRTPWHYLTFHYLRLHFPSRWFPLASFNSWASLLALSGNNLPAMWENQVWSLGWNISLGKEMTTQFRILACKIPWIEDPDGLSLTCLRRIIGFICKGSYKLGMLKAQRTKPFSVDLGWTAGHRFRERRKAQDWEIARLIWLVFQKKKKTKSSLKISWALNWGLYIPQWLTSLEKLFSNSGPISFSILQLLKYFIFVTSHSDLPVSSSLLHITSPSSPLA